MANDCLPPVFHKAADRNGPASDRPPDTLSGGLLHPALFFRRAVVRGTDRTGRAMAFPSGRQSSRQIRDLPADLRRQTFLPASGSRPGCHRPSHADQPKPGQGRQRGEHDHHATGTDRAGQPRAYLV